MSLIDFILNLAGLLLLANWRAQPRDTTRLAPPATLVGTLRRADRPALRGWQFPAVLGLLLFLRALIYWQIGPAVNWTGILDLGVVSISFRSDYFWRMLLFSGLSFGLMFWVFLLWLLLLSLLRPPAGEPFVFQSFLRANLGAADAWPRGLKLMLPLVAAAIGWWLLTWPLAHWGIVPRPVSTAHRFEQALVIGLGSYLTWKYVIAAVLILHLLNSYIYFGKHPLWNYVDKVARRILVPLRTLPLRLGRLDFAPVVMLALVFLVCELVAGGRAVWFFGWRKVPGLVDLYLRLPL